MSKFSAAERERIELAASAPRAPEKYWPPMSYGPMSRCVSRSWFEWFARRGRDPRTKRERTPGWMRSMVVERDGMVCGICRLPIAGADDLHIDHIKPVAHGGATRPDNLQPAHAFCNISKHSRWEE